MKSVAILGGLGSQMMKYSIYFSLCKSTTDFCSVDISFFNNNDCWNGFELDRLFGLQIADRFEQTIDETGSNLIDKTTYLRTILTNLSSSERLTYYYMGTRHTFRKGSQFDTTWNRFRLSVIRKTNMLMYFFHPKEKFSTDIFSIKGNLYIDECFLNSDRVFSKYKDEIKKLFTFKLDLDEVNKRIANKMLSEDSICIHVRRSDHLDDNGKLFKREYYKKSMAFIREKHLENELSLYIFSDDISWCKTNLDELGIDEKDNIVFVDWNQGEKSYVDMQLMTYCKDNILAISSFSWWGYYLSQRDNKIVCAPKGYWLEVDNHF